MNLENVNLSETVDQGLSLYRSTLQYIGTCKFHSNQLIKKWLNGNERFHYFLPHLLLQELFVLIYVLATFLLLSVP